MAQCEHRVAAWSGRIGSGPGERDGDLARASPPYREPGVDSRWEHSLVVVNAEGRIVEEWTQWDKLFKRPHAVYISPYDAEKHVWVVDDHTHAIYKFTNDGKQLVQTIGTPNVPGADGTHFNRPTFMAWLPDGSFYVSDGYHGTRVAKFDAGGTFQFDFGMRGESGKETRPGYMNNVHGVAVDSRRDASSSTIVTTTASRSSTRRAPTSPSGGLPSAPRASISCRSAPTAPW